MNDEDIIRQIVYKVRNQQGGNAEALLGNCTTNAKILKNELDAECSDWDVSIACGAINIEGEPTPQSYQEAKETGTLHNWVICKTENDVFHCDLASESIECISPGSKPMIRKNNPPSDYIYFNNL